MGRPKKSEVPQTFIDATNTMTTEELRNEILKASANVDEIEEARENDGKFQVLKETYTDAAAGYRDGINAEKAKAAYAKLVLKNRGQTVAASNITKPTTAKVAQKS